MTDQAKPTLVEIDVCSGPTLSRAERLAFRPTPRPASAARKDEPVARSPSLPVAAE
jgi:hypothetical protein